MKDYKVTAAYFSATGTNKKSVCTIAKEIADTYEQLDMTKYDAVTEEKLFTKNELLVIGAPVYAGRIYKGALKRFGFLKGQNTPCVITVTYGNRHYDDALLELSEFMKSQGFVVVAAAALIGEHTYGTIQPGRPDANDVTEDQEFAKKVAAKLETDEVLKDIKVPGNHPYRDGGDGGSFRPETSEACNKCGLCVEACPEGAIDPRDCKTINPEKCISCFRCIRICKRHAKNMETEEYRQFAEKFSDMLAVARANEYYI